MGRVRGPEDTKPCCTASRCNGHLQGAAGAGTAAGSVHREGRGSGQKAEGVAASDIFSEMNLTEIQKLKQQLLVVNITKH